MFTLMHTFPLTHTSHTLATSEGPWPLCWVVVDPAGWLPREVVCSRGLWVCAVGDRQPRWRQARRCPRWEEVMTLRCGTAGTRAFKTLRKRPLSKQWLHWRKAHPGLTLKKPNCLLQREKATSCHRPCSGKNVSGLAVAVRAPAAWEALGATS